MFQILLTAPTAKGTVQHPVCVMEDVPQDFTVQRVATNVTAIVFPCLAATAMDPVSLATQITTGIFVI